jgi:hypothetical protein
VRLGAIGLPRDRFAEARLGVRVLERQLQREPLGDLGVVVLGVARERLLGLEEGLAGAAPQEVRFGSACVAHRSPARDATEDAALHHRLREVFACDLRARELESEGLRAIGPRPGDA